MATGILSARGRGVAFAVAALALVLLNIDTMWTASVDLAQHYGVANWLAEHLAVPAGFEPTLNEMSPYPPLGHGIAAAIGTVLHSQMLGLHVASLLALAVLWLSVLAILLAFRDGRAVASIVILAGLVLLNRLTLGIDLHGGEIVGNYFYPQLVAQAFLFLFLLGAVRVEREAGMVAAMILMMAGILLVGFVHLLPAVEMLGVVLGTIVIGVFEAARRNRRRRWPIATLGAIACAALVGITLAHPSFVAMAELSSNDGTLDIVGVPYPAGILLLCLLVLAVSVLLFATWARSSDRAATLPAKYLALYGTAVAGLCLLQLVLRIDGYGSSYAVKKYGFGLTTILFIDIAILLGGFWSKRQGRPAGPATVTAVALAAFFAVVLSILPRQGTLDVSHLVALEQRLIALKQTSLPTNKDIPNIVIDLPGGGAIIDFAYSTAILETPKVAAVPDLMLGGDIRDAAQYAFVISARDNQRYGAAECPSLTPGDLSVVTGACIAERLVRASDCQEGFDLTETGAVPASLLTGFSHPEPDGRWTDGTASSFQCTRQPGETLRSVRIVLLPFVHGDVRAQRLAVRLNGTPLGAFERTGAADEGGEIRLDIPPELNSDTMRLDFEIPDAASPLALGLSTDSRALGFKVREIAFE